MARPLGGIVAGHLGDKRGRKPMLVLALTLMGLATTGIGVLPTYETIGVAAPVLLVALRVLASCFLSIMYGPQAALFAELFTAEMRYTGVSLGYQIAAVAGGGLAPFVMVLLLEATGTSMAVSGYIIGLSVVALTSIKVLADRARSR